MATIILWSCISALLMQCDAQLLIKNRTYISRQFPALKTKLNFTREEWTRILKDLQPKVDGPLPANSTLTLTDEVGRLAVNMHIIGGSSSTRGQLPWQAHVLVDGSGTCGGSLITPLHVLTAAHCTQTYMTFTVSLGAQDIRVFESGRVSMETDKKIVHSGYNMENLKNDIALLVLPLKVTSTNTIRPIRLPSTTQAKGEQFVSANVTASGWGRTTDDSWASSDTLNHVVLNVISIKECLEAYGAEYVRNTNICVSGKDFKATCNGDSGGPLAYKDKTGVWIQLGVVSFGSGEGCAKSLPSVFTRVSSYLSWLACNTGYAWRYNKM